MNGHAQILALLIYAEQQPTLDMIPEEAEGTHSWNRRLGPGCVLLRSPMGRRGKNESHRWDPNQLERVGKRRGR